MKVLKKLKYGLVCIQEGTTIQKWYNTYIIQQIVTGVPASTRVYFIWYCFTYVEIDN